YSDTLLVFEDTIPFIECTKEEKAISISKSFWKNYYEIKAFKDTPSISTSSASIERKALSNVNALLVGKIPEIESYLPFLRDLREDILEYKTLSDYTLRRIANLNSPNKSSAKLKGVKEELANLRQELGENYMEKVKARLGKLETEVIIAIENIKE
ncbi:MAG: helicase, partial [Atribacterota bacterium]|nr:helicase [Atribacterota bacterium]